MGVHKYGRMAILGVISAVAGQFFAMHLWGNPKEYWHLKSNKSLYKKELNNYKNSFF